MSISETSATHRRLWFVRRNGTVRGPFPTPLLKRYLLLRRLKQTDELSLDQQAWQPVSTYPMFAPDRLADDSAVLLAREDERSSGDRRTSEPPDSADKERRSGVERRAEESAATVERRDRRARVVASLKPAQESHRAPATIALLLLVGIIVSGFLFRPGGSVSEPICVAPAAPGVNWSNCRKEKADLSGVDLRNALLRNGRFAAIRLAGANLAGSDLAYADLTGADLRNCNLRGATATGANLHQAALENANLENTDLTYVDFSDATLDGAALSGAKLGNAIWIDGTSCAPASIGECAAR